MELEINDTSRSLSTNPQPKGVGDNTRIGAMLTVPHEACIQGAD
jgi:hypothetical protein